MCSFHSAHSRGHCWVCLVVVVFVYPRLPCLMVLLSVCLDLSLANELWCVLCIHAMNWFPAKGLGCVRWIHLVRLFLPALSELGWGVVVVICVVSVLLLLASAVAYVLVRVQVSWWLLVKLYLHGRCA